MFELIGGRVMSTPKNYIGNQLTSKCHTGIQVVASTLGYLEEYDRTR